MKIKYNILFFILLTCSTIFGQNTTKRALFLGNSYTGVNNLPQMVADVAVSAGDILIFDSNTPGGLTLQGHSTNTTSMSKIAAGNWDFVVLQEQSQRPSFPDYDVEMSVFPYAEYLNNMITAANPCAETVFYMTWGRQNGDPSICPYWPPVCTYQGMDDLINLRYRMMADANDAILSPVGAVWHYIRQNYPAINLYQTDESHPSVAGTYAAACAFYVTLFRKDPTAITFNSSLSPTVAANIRAAAKEIVYDNLSEWHIGEYDPVANFTYTISDGKQVTFTNNSSNATTYSWSFGDGATSSNSDPVHTFMSEGTYTVALTANKCGSSDIIYETINITLPLSLTENEQLATLLLLPNPVTNVLDVNIEWRGESTYKIVSMSGREVKAGDININNKRIDVSALSKGVYILQLFDDNKLLAQQKFVKN